MEVSPSSIGENGGITPTPRNITIISNSTLGVTILVVARCVGAKICTASAAENGAILETEERVVGLLEHDGGARFSSRLSTTLTPILPSLSTVELTRTW